MTVTPSTLASDFAAARHSHRLTAAHGARLVRIAEATPSTEAAPQRRHTRLPRLVSSRFARVVAVRA